VNTWGDDMPEVKNWKWSGTEAQVAKAPEQEQE
jgi:hypothetical protein